ncbi:MAG: Flavodoxin-like fold, partial [Verrucomicrobiaceae bacterium]|nr:Flavodoxin-like fold [Verrucomicrobiaceae bacterium]
MKPSAAPAIQHNKGKSLRVLVIDAHPRQDSLCHALANAFTVGASSEGYEVRRIMLSELQFDLTERRQ